MLAVLVRAQLLRVTAGRLKAGQAAPLAYTTGIILALAGVFLSISRRPGRPA